MGLIKDFNSAIDSHRNDFMLWAFGEDDGRSMPTRWNERHGEKHFFISEDSDPEVSLPMMIDAHHKSNMDKPNG